MEKTLFNWEDWDLLDTMAFIFYECTLKVPIGSFPVGYYAGSILVDYEKGILVIFDNEDKEYKFSLNLQIGEPLSV